MSAPLDPDVKDINDLGIESFLSPYVDRLLKRFTPRSTDGSGGDTRDHQLVNHALDDNLCLNWSQVARLIPDDIDIDAEVDEQVVDKLVTVCHLIESIDGIYGRRIATDFDGFCRLLSTNLFWTQELRHTFIESVRLVRQDMNQNIAKSADNILSLQLITSCCEQSLGNLILTGVPFVPPLLKDLLRLPQLKEIIGGEAVLLLQLTIGSPITLNVRNLLWHGFMAAEDVDHRFGLFLLCICATIGRDLSDKYRHKPLPQRPLQVIAPHVHRWHNLFPILGDNDLIIITESVLKRSPFILKRMLSLWTYSCDLYKTQHFGHSMAVVFPLMECSLRYIYCMINAIPSKLMTAVAKQYYLTFAEILSPTLPDSDGQRNGIYRIFSQSFVEMLLDAIVIPDGPRVRDKLSHGQLDLFRVDPFVANHCLCVAVCALVLADIQLFHRRDHYESIAIVSQLLRVAADYRCFYHPLSQLRLKLIDFELNVRQLKRLSSDASLRHENSVPIVSTETDLLLQELSQLIPTSDGKDLLQTISGNLNELNIDIVANGKSESEVCALRQICDNSHQSVENMRQFLEIRHKQWSDKTLRSRQRTNYQLMVNSVECFESTFCIVLSTLYLIFISDVKLIVSQLSLDLMKSLRQLLTLCENMSVNSGLTVNKWDKCYQLCQTIAEIVRNLLLNELKVLFI